MDQHPRHAERVGDETGVLPAGPAEAVERVVGHVVAALHRDLLDRIGHVLDRDLDEAVGDLLSTAAVADLRRELGEAGAHRLGVERQVLLGPEDARKEVRDQLASHDVGVSHRERATAAIAGRSRIGAGGVRTDAKARAVEMQNRAAAGGDRVDQHHRRAHAHAGDLGLVGTLVRAGVVRHIGRGAAHVEADQPVEAGFPSGLGHADDAAGRSRQNRILAAEQFGRRKPARRHHEHQAGLLGALPPLTMSPFRAACGR